jgi:glutathione S-transferase
MMVVRLSHPALAALEGQKPEIADYNLATAEKFMKALDRQLKGRDFIAADRITIADVVAASSFDFMRLVKYRPPEALVELARWLEAMRARPAAKAGI